MSSADGRCDCCGRKSGMHACRRPDNDDDWRYVCGRSVEILDELRARAEKAEAELLDTSFVAKQRDAALARVRELEKTADYSVTHLKYQARIAELERSGEVLKTQNVGLRGRVAELEGALREVAEQLQHGINHNYDDDGCLSHPLSVVRAMLEKST